ncbi:MAG: hypothetical protein FWB91_02115 [Defluviitaleaceae bacterium]|nr:hypothetical protein [Defluviitaleaceae bacterium]
MNGIIRVFPHRHKQYAFKKTASKNSQDGRLWFGPLMDLISYTSDFSIYPMLVHFIICKAPENVIAGPEKGGKQCLCK